MCDKQKGGKGALSHNYLIVTYCATRFGLSQEPSSGTIQKYM
jgi:hypothetical protein